MGICSNNKPTGDIKLNIFLKSLLYHNNINEQFTAPIGTIKDEPQLQAEYFNIQIWNQFEALRKVREDQNQLYNMLAFFAFKQVIERNDQVLLQKMQAVSQSLQWQVQVKGKQNISNNMNLKNEFLNLLQKVVKDNYLFELYYSDIKNNRNFYVLCIIFFRNWAFDIASKYKAIPSNSNEIQKMLDWTVPFNLTDQILFGEIVLNMNLKINIFDTQTKSLQQFGTAQNENYIIKNKDQIFIGLPKQYFSRVKPSAIIYQLYKYTNQARNVAAEMQRFVSEDLNQQELIYEYQMTQEMFQQIKLRGFKRVRGDGNCFYTAFIYQYLSIVITKFGDQDFKQFVEILQKIDFNLTHETIQNFPVEIRKDLKQIFLSFIYEIIGSNNQIQAFENEFQNTRSIFYALSIIYAKNLIHYFVEQNYEYKVLLGEEAEEQIQQWELETDNIQVLLVILANCLNLILHFYFIDADNKTIDLQLYQQSQNELTIPKQNVYLLFCPGHYCIGLPIEKK
ncbi:unnamed protein product (macronuclear) [Paramecium tetraurelia]|uniref:ubiquitinyl hydrolase 1 n=1 Tax=Paramecium tetraurelia TaxID=5888 RepID=A0CEC0_PARTE|nr:uncharacterized protein GSPATT00037573001 [Paramecium tetraurelia]CAK69137.1 unnamed protein product [Paramecium tetraurelia]|eukprot:XP_001436534.1 hypothetical protein (macronuclear) [Paramecium tetraurelia strain d4-2]